VRARSRRPSRGRAARGRAHVHERATARAARGRRSAVGHAVRGDVGIVRARYRHGDAVEEPVTPGDVEEYFIDMWALGYQFDAGHRLRLEISSSDFDRYDRNPNTGARFGEGSELRRAEQTVHHSARYPSRLTLPVRRRS
jgi:predicted acyl esterase